MLTPDADCQNKNARWSDLLLASADRRRRAIFALIGLTYLLGFNGQWQLEPDSGLYLALGRNLALGRGYTYRGLPHDMVYPGFPYALAALYRFFGSHIIVAADAMILLCALAALALTYRLMYLAYDRPTAVIITVGVAFAHEFYRYSFEILTDMPFLMGAMAVLAGHEGIFGRRARDGANQARWWDWALLLGGLVVAISSRPTMIGLCAAWIAALLWLAVRRGKWPTAALVVCLVLVALAAFYWFDPRRLSGQGFVGPYEQFAFLDWKTRLLTVGANLQDLLGVTGARALFGMPLGWPVNVVLGTAVLAGGVALLRKSTLWGLWVIVTILVLVLLISHDRYVLQALPLLIAGWWQILRKVNLRLPMPKANYAFAFLLVLGIGPNTGQVIGVILRQRWMPFLAHYKEGRFLAFVEMASELPKYTTGADVILCPLKLSRELSFLSDRNVYEENEPFAAYPNHLFVICDPRDPKDPGYGAWLDQERVVVDKEVLIRKPRATGQPAIWLARARIAGPGEVRNLNGQPNPK